MAAVDLIKTVRGLDQTGPGKNGENLETLWGSLVASSDGQFHAAEESCLRWLLKSMNGSSQDAETVRRYPLTWTILDCVFTRIPLFSLAKSLADRRFMAVLQQTLKEISKPAADDSPSTSKRKRSTTKSFALEDLKSRELCLYTAQAVLRALQSMLNRIDNTSSLSSHDRIGAEHIKSLFGTSATEATAIISPLMTICNLTLTSDNCDEFDGREDWVQTMSALWDLHLQSSEDTIEVATHLFNPASVLLNRLEGFLGNSKRDIDGSLRTRWSQDLQKLMHRSLILPAKAAFLNRQDFEAVTRALDVSKEIIDTSSAALYFLASGAFELQTKHDLRRGNAEWIKKIFQAVEETIRGRPDRNTLIRAILKQAVKKSMPIALENLRSVCRTYALEGETDWELVAAVAESEPSVFQSSQQGTDLLNDVCKRSIAAAGKDYAAVRTVVAAVMQGFRTARNISGFLKLWFQQLCAIEDKPPSHSAWIDISKESEGESLESLIEKELSAHQLLEVLKWVEAEPKHPHALCIFSQTIAEGVHAEAYVDGIGARLLDLLEPVESTSSPTTALKWRVVSKTISWVPLSNRPAIWSTVKKQLSKILKKSPTKSVETFEAFKCCCQAWISLGLDEHASEPAAVVEAFTDRLAAEIATTDVLEGMKLSSCIQTDVSEFVDDLAYHKYLAWCLHGSSRLTRLHSKGLPAVLQNAIATQSPLDGLRTVWTNLLQNDVNLNDVRLAKDLVDRLVKSLAESENEKHWPGERGILCIRLLGGIPLDTVSRPQRESIMEIVSRRRAKMLKSPKHITAEDWKIVLGLATKMMGRPTFYEGMAFTDLIETADAVSKISLDGEHDETAIELIGRFLLMASTVIRQMAEHIEDRSVKYLTGSSDFIALCEARAGEKDAALPPLYLTLLKALATELTRSPNCRSHEELSSLAQRAKQALTQCVLSVVGSLVENKKLFGKQDSSLSLSLFAAVDAAESAEGLAEKIDHKASTIRRFEERAQEVMQLGDIRAWKAQAFLITYLPSELEASRPTAFESLEILPSRLRASLLRERVDSITRSMEPQGKIAYLKDLIGEYTQGHDTDGQLYAVQQVVSQLIETPDLQEKSDYNLAAAQGELVSALASAKTRSNFAHLCRILHSLLEKRPQSMSQWNIEITLSTICALVSDSSETANASFTWICKLVEVIIKKHRLRLEGHYHILLATLQALLRNLILNQHLGAEEALAHTYTRLITLVCEPTAGAVSRAQQHSALDSATDAAKRSAGRHMYMLLMQYVKLQLEANVSKTTRDALEPAMNSIFAITTPEGRKILNDSMDASGRAILREMFKRYTKFGKWSGV